DARRRGAHEISVSVESQPSILREFSAGDDVVPGRLDGPSVLKTGSRTAGNQLPAQDIRRNGAIVGLDENHLVLGVAEVSLESDPQRRLENRDEAIRCDTVVSYRIEGEDHAAIKTRGSNTGEFACAVKMNHPGRRERTGKWAVRQYPLRLSGKIALHVGD